MKEKIEEILTEHDIRPTAVRSLVLDVLAEQKCPATATEIEGALQTVDRSSITRALALFAEKGLLHIIDDGTGMPKYEMCPSHSHRPDDSHAHFHCRKCGKTICMEALRVACPQLPPGYTTDTVSCVITGLCPRCSASM